MKVITPKEMARVEALAYQDGFSEGAFMEAAGKGIAEKVHQYIEQQKIEKTVCLLCGKGNNSGDAYVAGLYLLEKGYSVFAIQVTTIQESSPLCKKNYGRFVKRGGKVQENFPANGILLDGLFGTGFHGGLKEPFASLVSRANGSGLPILAIDIPSGLNGETGEIEGPSIEAQETLYLGLPKTGFFFNQGWNRVGKLRSVDFGLLDTYSEKADAEFQMAAEEMMPKLMPKVVRNRHKYQAGHVVGLAGSPNMPGASLLASEAVLRGGAGMIHLLHPEGMQAELSHSLYEVIKIPYTTAENALEKLNKGKAAFIGPGIGREPQTRDLLKQLLAGIKVPCVLDADALTIIGEDALTLPSNAILTPHHGEMAKLLNAKELDSQFLNTCQNYARDQNCTLVLKGGPTFIFHPEKQPIANPTGCPGMATAGSGDVLTGLLAALLAQGLQPFDAAMLSVYLHGAAGEIAEKELTPYCMIASDITHHFPRAFKSLTQVQ